MFGVRGKAGPLLETCVGVRRRWRLASGFIEQKLVWSSCRTAVQDMAVDP
jgi:hypothetical protein